MVILLIELMLLVEEDPIPVEPRPEDPRPVELRPVEPRPGVEVDGNKKLK